MENQFGNVRNSMDGNLLPMLDSMSSQFEHSYDDSQDDIEDDRCFQMEIDQLKRQNNFLKKKLAELSKRSGVGQSALAKRKSVPVHIKTAPQLEKTQPQNYIIAFFDQIGKLLQSVSDLFKLGIETTITKELQKQQLIFNELTTEKDADLGRRLSRMLLQPQQKRFGQLLDIFESYYRSTTERNCTLKLKIQNLTTQAIQLGKRLSQSVRHRQRIKSSRIVSVLQQHEQSKNQYMQQSMKSSIIKSTCTDSQLDLSACRLIMGKDKLFLNIFG